MSGGNLKLEIDEQTGLPTPDTANGPDWAKARRAVKMTDTSASSSFGGGFTYDGTGDYRAWKGYATLRGIEEGGGELSAKAVARLLRGTAAMDLANSVTGLSTSMTSYPFANMKAVFDALEQAGHGGSTDMDKGSAFREMTRCRQGSRKLEEFLPDFNRLASLSGVAEWQKIAMLKASLTSRLAVHAVNIEQTNYGSFVTRLREIDAVAPREQQKQQGGRNEHRTKGRGAKSTEDTRKCYNCDEQGHLANRCPKPKKARRSAKKPEEEDDDARSIVAYSGNE